VARRLSRRVRLARTLIVFSALVALTVVLAVDWPGAARGAPSRSAHRTSAGRSSTRQAASPVFRRPPARASESLPPVAKEAAPPSWGAQLLGANVATSSDEAVVVRAASLTSTTNTVSLWQRTASGWQQDGPAMPGQNGDLGWSSARVAGDLRSPVGVYTLTYAGGMLPNPGTKMPYEYDPAYFDTAGTFLGHNLHGVFDYVVAIDFNRQAGTPPSNMTEPEGPTPGNGIWLHVSNGVPTQGCVTLSQADMASILQWLAPSQHPVIVMDPGASLLS
jgi:L,D-peptidoglycan transpeptidase YkuD (ErfK/YbiS/YcfS/YnhG family)